MRRRRSRLRTAFQIPTLYKGWKTGKVNAAANSSFPDSHPPIEGGKLGNPQTPSPAVALVPTLLADQIPRRLTWEEVECPKASESSIYALRLLARWLVSAARKGTPMAVSGYENAPQKRLDVGGKAKVGSVVETPEMPAQQALQKGLRR